MVAPHYVRPPVVAGQFYPGDPASLRAEVARRLGDTSAATPALGAMAPHAGYVYSGDVAGATFARLAVPRRVIILGPNHTGRGTPVAVAAAGAFRVPGGEIPIDQELGRAVLAEVPGSSHDLRAHEREHSIEVELPFLRERRPDVRIVPVVLAGLPEAETIAIGLGLARAVAEVAANEDVLVLASSDMSHYVPDPLARRLDRLAIDRIKAIDPEGLFRTVEANDITMCGYIPATAMLAYARARGASHAELVRYATSGDVSGDQSQVVGYAGITVH